MVPDSGNAVLKGDIVEKSLEFNYSGKYERQYSLEMPLQNIYSAHVSISGSFSAPIVTDIGIVPIAPGPAPADVMHRVIVESESSAEIKIHALCQAAGICGPLRSIVVRQCSPLVAVLGYAGTATPSINTDILSRDIHADVTVTPVTACEAPCADVRLVHGPQPLASVPATWFAQGPGLFTIVCPEGYSTADVQLALMMSLPTSVAIAGPSSFVAVSPTHPKAVNPEHLPRAPGTIPERDWFIVPRASVPPDPMFAPKCDVTHCRSVPLLQSFEQHVADAWTKRVLDSGQRVAGLKVPAVAMVTSPTVQDRFREYCKDLPEPNVRLLWHGAPAAHSTDGLTCGDPVCAMCSIVTGGFVRPSLTVNADGGPFQRFGAGVYLSSNPGKAYSYFQDRTGTHHANTMTLIPCLVAVGRPYRPKHAMRTLMAAPDGYDSVWAIPGECSNLNYNEIVLYNPAAVLPLGAAQIRLEIDMT